MTPGKSGYVFHPLMASVIRFLSVIHDSLIRKKYWQTEVAVPKGFSLCIRSESEFEFRVLSWVEMYWIWTDGVRI